MASGNFDRLKAVLAGFVASVMNRVDFLAFYTAKVAVQNGDGTLELVPTDPRLPPQSSVPIRYGIPGVTVTVAAGALVLLGFENGDPGRPVATLWETASVTQMNITATDVVINSGSSGVARNGDQVQITFDATAAGKLSCAAAPGPCSLTAGSFTVNGTITAGSAHVKAG